MNFLTAEMCCRFDALVSLRADMDRYKAMGKTEAFTLWEDIDGTVYYRLSAGPSRELDNLGGVLKKEHYYWTPHQPTVVMPKDDGGSLSLGSQVCLTDELCDWVIGVLSKDLVRTVGFLRRMHTEMKEQDEIRKECDALIRNHSVPLEKTSSPQNPAGCGMGLSSLKERTTERIADSIAGGFC